MTGLWLGRVSTPGLRYSRLFEEWTVGSKAGMTEKGSLDYGFYFVETEETRATNFNHKVAYIFCTS